MRTTPLRRRMVAGAVCSVSLLCAGVSTAGGAAASHAQTAPPGSFHAACPDGSGSTPVYRDTQYTPEERAADLVSCMTLAEKVAQLHTNSAPAIPRLGVQPYTYWSEGQHGINRINSAGGPVNDVHATSFPTNFASTMSWDPGLVYQETTAISDEARGLLDKSLWGTGQNNLGPSRSDYGNLTYWAPTVNMDRDPRWGRTDEAFGEDPDLASKMAGAFVNGYQGNTMSGHPITGYLKVASTAKHYALNNNENNRHADSSDSTDANIRDYYTAQFRNLVMHDHVSGVMTSYNAINGTPSPADTYTANELLQRTYGFGGYTTSDCGAVHDIYASGSHDWAPPGWTTSTSGGNTTWTSTATGQQISGAAGGQAFALRAGTDLNCTGKEETLANIQQAIGAGVLSEGVIDNALVHLFTVRMKTGEFDPPSQVPYTKITKDAIQSPAHQALARKVADQSLVLLKNGDVPGTASPLLPADPATLSKVVIVGDLAGKVTLGDYSGDPSLQVSAVQGITNAVRAANPGAQVVYDSCHTSTTATAPASCSAQTQAAIRSADLVIVFAGTDLRVATEGHDRTTLAMPGNYDSMVNQVAALGNPRMALVVQSSGPVTIDHVQGDFPAIVFSGYNGESQGSALADVLFGKVDPSGHLDFTWYKNDSQLPGIKNYGLTPSQTGGLGRTYMYFTGTPTYPFGYGLSYTRFTYSHVMADPGSVPANGRVNVHFDVTNTGATPGSTVAQVYTAPRFSVPGVELPRERLAGFQKTAVLQPGQTQSISIPVKVSDLSMWDESARKQVVYDGPYQFRVGADASNFAGTPTVQVSGAITPRVRYVTVQPDKVVFKPGDTLDLTGTNPWIAPDTNPALEEPHASADHVVEAVNNDQSFADLSGAHVTYHTSNPGVAQVSRTGMVTAVAAGAATISVTVNGVTGSAPIVVRQPLDLRTPAVVTAGSAFTATTALPNTGTAPLTNVKVSLAGPGGWTVTATSPSSFATVAPGQTATTSWRVTAPSGTSPGTDQLVAQAAFDDASGPGSASSVAGVNVPYPSLAGAFDNVGISSDASPSAGNFNGHGTSYSEQALTAAGLSPGTKITHDVVTFTWPDIPAGQPDNVVGGGQTVALAGSGTTIGFLGAATGPEYGASGTGTVYYADGTASSYTLKFDNWFHAFPGNDVIAATPYHNKATGRVNGTIYIFYAGVPITAGKKVVAITLPGADSGGALHIFATGIG